ncbi:uncharacterized protein LOC62_05G007744 [Vanrija pseudolonga]|uniref:Uncharacterized protein n=1 Tax=Vanrija pseudolonga TaxID=143232 RepID=A0AAF1BKQ2_9TREE|nr:hypothetical protein LOC62_05G007744 [Vanrija pseudolonga]
MSVMSTSYTARKLGRMDPGGNGRLARSLIADYVESRLEAGVPPSQIARDLNALADKVPEHGDNIDAGRAHLARFNHLPDIDVTDYMVSPPQSSSIVRRLSGRARRHSQPTPAAATAHQPRPPVVRLPSNSAETPPPPYTRSERAAANADVLARLGAAENANLHLVTQLSAAEARIAQLEEALANAQH